MQIATVLGGRSPTTAGLSLASTRRSAVPCLQTAWTSSSPRPKSEQATPRYDDMATCWHWAAAHTFLYLQSVPAGFSHIKATRVHYLTTAGDNSTAGY